MSEAGPSTERGGAMRPAARVVLALLIAAVYAHLLLSAWYAFTNYKCGESSDYARYLGMVWNTAHGRPYEYGTGFSYLHTHLSFTLPAIGLAFRVWDHPFLLQAWMWVFAAAGGLILLAMARRRGLSWEAALALLLFLAAYHFTQSTLLCEFHGVSAYYLLVPWLAYCAFCSRRWAWLPLALTLGLREEAGFMVAPLLAYAAVKERWRAGWWYAAAAVAYSAVALLAIYPAVNGVSIFARRHAEIEGAGPLGRLTDPAALWQRAKSLGWILLPVLPLLARRSRWPLLAIPALAVLFTLGSSFRRQYGLTVHYPAVVMATLAVAAVEAQGLLRGDRARAARIIAAWFPAYLVLVTGFSYYWRGFLAGSRTPYAAIYQRPRFAGMHTLWVARQFVDRTGTIATERRFNGFVGNARRLCFESVAEACEKHDPDVVFCRTAALPESCRGKLRDGSMGVRYGDAMLTVCQKGADTNRNAAVLALLEAPVVAIAYTRGDGRCGEVLDPAEGALRHWRGLPRAEVFASYGGTAALGPGRYRATLAFRTAPPADAAGRWGRVEFADTAPPRPVLARAPIEPSASRAMREQRIEFSLASDSQVELRVIGEAAPLWLRDLKIEPVR